MPPYHPLLGHIPVLSSITASLPSNAHAHYLADQLRRRYPDLGPIYYLDAWPFAPPFLVVVEPSCLSQITSKQPFLPNHPGIKKYLRPITRGQDLSSMEGQEWKSWRRVFAAGFSASSVAELVPGIVEEVDGFREVLRQAEGGEIVLLDEKAINVTMDVIGRVALDHRFCAQANGGNDFTDALRSQVRWTSFGAEMNPWRYVNPAKYFMWWWNRRVMDRYMIRVLEERYAVAEQKGEETGKTVIDLARKAWIAEPEDDKQEAEATSPPSKSSSKQKARADLASHFARQVLGHMKLFILGGHDTTATAVCYSYLLLSRHPSALRTLRHEHTRVFGPSIALTRSLISSHPALLNKLPYTLACIRETLRLFPVVTSPRLGLPSFSLTSPAGHVFPTQDCLVWSCHHGIHNSPLYWPRVGEFLPERWLVPEGHELHPQKDCWRPFEWGARACIGQELAVTELKIVLAMTAREFDIVEAYGEWDAKKERQGGKRDVEGERAYQVQMGSGRASDGFPCRVKFADGAAEVAAVEGQEEE